MPTPSPASGHTPPRFTTLKHESIHHHFTALKYHSVKPLNYLTIQTIFKHFITLIN